MIPKIFLLIQRIFPYFAIENEKKQGLSYILNYQYFPPVWVWSV